MKLFKLDSRAFIITKNTNNLPPMNKSPGLINIFIIEGHVFIPNNDIFTLKNIKIVFHNYTKKSPQILKSVCTGDD